MTRPRPEFRWPRPGIAAAAALALSMGCTSAEPPALGPGPDAIDASDESVRIKGLAPHLRIHRQRGGEVELLRDGAMAHEGDLVQLSYMAAGNRYGVVVSLDGGGGVTLHHPAQAAAEPAVVSRGEHALDHAYELDGAVSYERFVFVTSGDEPIEVSAVLTAAQRLAARGEAARHSALPLPGRWRQSSITLDKRP